MNPTRIITYAGFTGTVREWAQRQGTVAHTLDSRLARNMSLARALTMPTQRPKHRVLPTYLEYKGKRATIAEWAAAIGMSEDGLRYRLYRGRTIEEALTEPPHKMPSRIQGRVLIKATSTAIKCYYCERTASMYHFLKTGVFKGAPLCGTSECISASFPTVVIER